MQELKGSGFSPYVSSRNQSGASAPEGMQLGQPNQVLDPTNSDADLYAELWISLGSLIRSYTTAHGLHNNLHAAIEIHEDRIVAHHGRKTLELDRIAAEVIWKREDGTSGTLHLTPAGRLRSFESEIELDMAAEAWARDLMRAIPRERK